MNMHTNFQSRVYCLWNLSKTDSSIVSYFLTSTKLKSSFRACRRTLLWGHSICCLHIRQSEGISADLLSNHRPFTGVRITVSFSSRRLHQSLLRHVLTSTKSKGQHARSLSTHINIGTCMHTHAQRTSMIMLGTETMATKRSTRIPSLRVLQGCVMQSR